MSSAQTQMNLTRQAVADWTRDSNTITQQFLSIGGRPDIISLAGGLPAAELYPIEAVAAATQRALARFGRLAMEYGPVEGLPALRELIARRIAEESGGSFSSANVMLTTGAMQGLDLVGKALLNEGDTVVAQSPTYLGALDAWRPRRPRYERLDWSEAAMDGERLRRAKFVYAVPNYSNPTGVLVPREARRALLERVIEGGTWLVEDDPYRTLQLDGDTGPSILALDAAQRSVSYDGPVIYLGTVSKSLVPGLRVGWIVAEASMIQALALAKQSSDLSSSMFTQAVAWELLESGFDTVHSRSMLPIYRERRDELCREAELRLSRWFEWEVPAGGMFVWMRAKHEAVDTDALFRIALEEKVAFVPGSVFDFTGNDRCSMRINFTRNPPQVLREGIARLERAVRRYFDQMELNQSEHLQGEHRKQTYD